MHTTKNEQNATKSMKTVWMITIGHGLTHWYPATFYLLLPLIGRELGLSYSEIGFIITFQATAGTIGNLLGGMVVDIIGKRGLLMAVSLFWIGIPYFIMGFAHHLWVLALCTALVGIGNTLWHPTAIPTLSELYPKKKGLVLSLHGMGSNVGDAAAPLAVGALLAILDWRQVVWINVIPGMVMATFILLFLRRLQSGPRKAGKETDRATFRSYFTGLKTLLRNRSLILLSISSAFRSMTQSVLNLFLPLFFLNELGFSTFLVGLCLFLLQASGFIAAPIAGHYSDRFGRKNIIVSGMAMTAILLLFMAAAGRTNWFILFIALLGFCLFAIRPVMQAWIMDATPGKMAGTSISILFSVQSMGAAIAPFLAGIIADTYGLFATFYFVAATIVVANLFVLFIPKDHDASSTGRTAMNG